MITTYDGIAAGDIRSTPDYVIEKPDAVLAAYVKGSPSTPEYVNYWPTSVPAPITATFDASDHNRSWMKSGSVTIMGTPPADPTGEAYGWAAQFGGVNDATGQPLSRGGTHSGDAAQPGRHRHCPHLVPGLYRND